MAACLQDDWAQDAAEVQSTDILLKGKRASVLAASNPSPGEHDAAVAAELEEDSGPAELASSSSEDEAAGADQKAKERWARLRGLAGPQSSSSESDDDERDKHAALEEESDDPDQVYCLSGWLWQIPMHPVFGCRMQQQALGSIKYSGHKTDKWSSVRQPAYISWLCSVHGKRAAKPADAASRHHELLAICHSGCYTALSILLYLCLNLSSPIFHQLAQLAH